MIIPLREPIGYPARKLARAQPLGDNIVGRAPPDETRCAIADARARTAGEHAD